MLRLFLAALVLSVVLRPAAALALVAPQETETQLANLAALRASAEAGDADAQVQLGITLAAGNGVSVDEAQAVEWFRRAADQGSPAGEYALAEMYVTGRGVATDYKEGFTWMRLSAEHGVAQGQANLGAMYSQGLGVDQDYNEAAKWARRAANQGLAAGQFALGSMYANGRGVGKSEAEAQKWYRLAADQGDVAATNNLALLLATAEDSQVRNAKEALVFGEKAIQMRPEMPTVWDTLATVYFQNGQPQRAVQAEEKAIELNPDNSAYKKALERYRDAAGNASR